MERTMPVGKHQPWPLSVNNRVKLWLDVRRDQQPIKVICGIDGCTHKVLGWFVDVRHKLAVHRVDEHPGWERARRRPVHTGGVQDVAK
jgi:hypothetical protein